MKKFLALTLVFMLCLSCLPGVAAFGTTNINSGGGIYNISTSPSPGGVGPREPEPEESDNSLYMGPIWRLNFDYDKAGEKLASAATYLLPVSADGVYEYAPGSWLLDQMLNKLDAFTLEQSCIELSAGSSGPVSAPALAPYTGGEAGEPVYSALFKLPAQGEGRSFPDDGTALVIRFAGNICISVPAQQAASVLSAIDLKVYSDRLVVELIGAEDAEAYIDLPCTGTPLWIDAEGNEVEAEYEDADGGFKVKVKSGLTLVFKA
ncbi:MAG: hypothetical protein IJB09_04500 [Oscillospiraceae bacterium]|nr:hypothetical protein [Oscillospiraceae bacterium]